MQTFASLLERRARARVQQKHGAGVHCCKGDSSCRVRVCMCLHARMCACTFLCVRACVPASVRACICTPEHVHEVYQAFWPACTHICAINRVQMCRNQRVRFYHAAHDRLYLALISWSYLLLFLQRLRLYLLNFSGYTQRLYRIMKISGYIRSWPCIGYTQRL